MRGFDEVAALLRRRSLEVCQSLLPGGKKMGGEYVTSDLGGGKGRSLSINLKSGVWKDFGGAVAGADLINLFAQVRGLTNYAAKLEAEKWLGLPEEAAPARGPKSLSAIFIKPEAAEPEEEEVPDQWWKRPDIEPVMIWDYVDQDGEVVAQVYRWEHKDYGKAVRPWCPKRKDWRAPEGDGRPLLYLADIAASATSVSIYVVEGEKTADALRAIGLVATSNLGGGQAVAKTDWSPLEGRHVVYCRDNDDAGKASQAKVLELLQAVKVASCRLLEPPRDVPEGWDLADAPPAQRIDLCAAAAKGKAVILGRVRLSLGDWGEARYQGEPEERRMLVEGIIPVGSVSMLAGHGGIGKGLRLLELAYKVAKVPGPINVHPDAGTWCGGVIRRHGRVVLIAGEDTHLELHNRLNALRRKYGEEVGGDRLTLVPLPNAGGNLPLIRMQGGSAVITDDFYRLRDGLARIDDLALVIFDPVARFAAANVERDVDASQTLLGVWGAMAAEMDIAALFSHHMAKARGNKDAQIKDLQTAREAVRGGTHLIDGVRACYALWAELDKEKAFEMLAEAGVEGVGPDEWYGAVVYGGVVKANGPQQRRVATYVRDEDAFRIVAVKIEPEEKPLEVVTPPAVVIPTTEQDQEVKVETKGTDDVPAPTPPEPRKRPTDPLDLLELCIAQAAKDGHPFKKTTNDGVWENRNRLPPPLNKMGAQKLRDLTELLITKNRISRCPSPGSQTANWLDIPGGPFFSGNGTHSSGAVLPVKV